MASTTLVSLVSDQTLPNVFFIKQFNCFDRYIFVSTKKMEKKERTKCICLAANVRGEKIEIIQVDAEHMEDVTNQLRKIKFKKNENIVIHITGGTKLMALAVYNFFVENMLNVKVFYKPLHDDFFLRIYPEYKKIDLSVKIDLSEYLTAYGLNIREKKTVSKYTNEIDCLNVIMQSVKNGKLLGEMLIDRECSRKKYANSGKWLEMWVAMFIKKHLNLTDREIAINVSINRMGVSDVSKVTEEYDVMYVRNNRLYVVECKYFSGGKFTKKKINKEWHKLAALQLHMGLYATSLFITANEIPEDVDKELKEVKDVFRIKGCIGIDVLSDEEKFESFIKNL